MHKHQLSFESTPHTVKSSNLSSVLDPNPVVLSTHDQYVDMNDGDQIELGNSRMNMNIAEKSFFDEEKSDIPVDADVNAPKISEETASPIDENDCPMKSNHSRMYSESDAASVIQRNWINKKWEKKQSQKKDVNDIRDDVSIASFKSNLQGNSETVNLNLPDDQLLYANLTRLSYVFESPMEKFLQSSSEDVHISASNEDLDLKEPWVAPSIEFSKNAASYTHPRRLGPDRLRYSLMKSSTGRHCVYKGCGEQCDLFHEGSFSFFGQFGAGITNYFKFIKWCFWVFVTLSVCNIPALIFSIHGDGGLRNLGKLTLGNVVPYNNTQYTYIPDCKENAAWSCRIEMENVGVVWEAMDLTGCIVVLIGFLWLRFFEKAEASYLNRMTVSPADYSVLVSNLPPGCKESDLRVYFAKLINQAVTDIVFVYDDEEDIELFKKRGRMVKRRYHITQQYRYHHDFITNQEKKRHPHEALQKTIPVNVEMKEFLEGKISRKGLLIQLKQQRSRVTAAIKVLDRRRRRQNKTLPEKPLNKAYVTFHSHAAKNIAIKKHKVTLLSKLRPNPEIYLKVSVWFFEN